MMRNIERVRATRRATESPRYARSASRCSRHQRISSLARLAGMDLSEAAAALRQRGILVRFTSRALCSTTRCGSTIGTPAEMKEALLTELKPLVAKLRARRATGRRVVACAS